MNSMEKTSLCHAHTIPRFFIFALFLIFSVLDPLTAQAEKPRVATLTISGNAIGNETTSGEEKKSDTCFKDKNPETWTFEPEPVPCKTVIFTEINDHLNMDYECTATWIVNDEDPEYVGLDESNMTAGSCRPLFVSGSGKEYSRLESIFGGQTDMTKILNADWSYKLRSTACDGIDIGQGYIDKAEGKYELNLYEFTNCNEPPILSSGRWSESQKGPLSFQREDAGETKERGFWKTVLHAIRSAHSKPVKGMVKRKDCFSDTTKLHYPYNYSYDNVVAGYGGGLHKKGLVDVYITHTLSYHYASDAEAVIIPEGNYSAWTPEAGKDEKSPGNTLTVSVKLHEKGQPDKPAKQKAQFKFELVDVSQEPGVCLNWPPKDKALKDFDLKIEQAKNPNLTVSADMRSADTKEHSKEAQVTITSFDWAAYGKLKVTVTAGDCEKIETYVQGDPSKKQLDIPLDDNSNHIADAWEKDKEIYYRNLAPDWDESENPKGQKCSGDGISVYEKYRGFVIGKNGAKEPKNNHQCLEPSLKYLFVYDPDNAVEDTIKNPVMAPYSFPKVSLLELIFIGQDTWTGPGLAGKGKRVVNFNKKTGHAVDQHALHVRRIRAENEMFPPKAYCDKWDESYGSGCPPVDKTGAGWAYPDPTFVGTDWLSERKGPFSAPYSSPGRVLEIHIYDLAIQEIIKQTLLYNLGEAPELVERYIKEHETEFALRFALDFVNTVSHELGHGVGVAHHRPDNEGSKLCVTRYHIPTEFARDPDDPLELERRKPWPNILCLDSTNAIPIVKDNNIVEDENEKGCYNRIKVTDRAEK